MTTITHKDGVIAYDSRMCRGGTITSDSTDKHLELNDAHFFFSGCVCDQLPFMEIYFNKSGNELLDIKHLDISAFIWVNGLLFHGLGYTSGVYITPLSMDEPAAIGSGIDHALTAMDMGATAKEAVKWAMKRDTGTGGRIRTFKI